MPAVTRFAGCLIALLPAMPHALAAQSTELAPGLVVYATSAGNIVTFGNAEGAFVVGPVTAASTATIQADLTRRSASAMRYVIVVPTDQSRADGDAGWGRLGAFVATHEAGWGRYPFAARPRAAFSEVLKFSLGAESIHAVHQPRAHSGGDVLVHFERSAVVYLGEMLPGDGYPVIDSAQGGTIDSLIVALSPWVHSQNQFVPGRGPAVGDTAVARLVDALVATRDRVRDMRNAGRTLEQVIAAHPSADFDATLGHGRVSPQDFVRSVYQTVGAH